MSARLSSGRVIRLEKPLVLGNDGEELRIACEFLWADSLVEALLGKDKVSSCPGSPANEGCWAIA